MNPLENIRSEGLLWGEFIQVFHYSSLKLKLSRETHCKQREWLAECVDGTAKMLSVMNKRILATPRQKGGEVREI